MSRVFCCCSDLILSHYLLTIAIVSIYPENKREAKVAKVFSWFSSNISFYVNNYLDIFFSLLTAKEDEALFFLSSSCRFWAKFGHTTTKFCFPFKFINFPVARSYQIFALLGTKKKCLVVRENKPTFFLNLQPLKVTKNVPKVDINLSSDVRSPAIFFVSCHLFGQLQHFKIKCDLQ